MKAGTENRKKVVFAVILLVAAVLLFVRMLAGWNSDSGVQPATTTAAVAVTPRTAGARRGKPLAPPSLDPRLRLKLLAGSEQIEYKGKGRNIFDRASAPEIEKPIQSVKKETPSPPTGPPPPPPPQPINLKFFGFANSTGEPRQVFLAQGEDVFVAKEGDIVNRRYKVLRIMPNSVEIEDVLNNNRQTIPLTQG